MQMQDNVGSIAFIIFYLTTIWIFIVKIIASNAKKNTLKERPSSWKWTLLAYFLLGFGDLFHLGVRIYVFFAGLGPDEHITNLSFAIGYVATGLSMTYFYIAMLHAWIEIYGEKYSTPKKNRFYLIYEYALFAIRIILVFLPYNRWYEGDATVDFGFDFRIISSLPIYGIGLLTVYLMLKTSKKEASSGSLQQSKRTISIDPQVNEGTRKAAWSFVVSYACYSLTNFFVAIEPLLGMAMIPKTIAYMVAFYFHYKYFLNRKTEEFTNREH